MSDLTDADQLADAFASFAVSKNPTGLSLGIDSAYELGDHIASTWLAEHDAKVRAEERERIATALREKFGVTNRAASWIEREAGLEARRFCTNTRDDEYGDGMACFLHEGHEGAHAWTRYAALPVEHPRRENRSKNDA